MKDWRCQQKGLTNEIRALPLSQCCPSPRKFRSRTLRYFQIGEVTDELIHDVNDELSEAYPKCQVMTYAPSDEMYGLEVLTNESFDYEMQGIVVDKSKPVNTIIYFGVKEMDE